MSPELDSPAIIKSSISVGMISLLFIQLTNKYWISTMGQALFQAVEMQ
jgi:hypothetical protein